MNPSKDTPNEERLEKDPFSQRKETEEELEKLEHGEWQNPDVDDVGNTGVA